MSRLVVVGEVLGPFGVRGWIKVRSYTDPPDNILNYSPWHIAKGDDGEEYELVSGLRNGAAVVACLGGVNSREQAALLRGYQISVAREQFPEPGAEQYYWVDLVGLEVRTVSGVILGKIAHMMQTGANDVMEVHGDRERLIPFVMGEFVKEVRLGDGFLIVDWDPEF